MKNTKTETELLQTIRKWEELCDESLADAAYWKGQAQNVPELLAALIEMLDASERPVNERWLLNVRSHARAAIAKAEGVK
jgi:hypothetical protein